MSSWAKSIILAVIVSTIIQMILPEGNNKKYIKTVIGLYILFTIISPIISNIISWYTWLLLTYPVYSNNLKYLFNDSVTKLL